MRRKEVKHIKRLTAEEASALPRQGGCGAFATNHATNLDQVTIRDQETSFQAAVAQAFLPLPPRLK
jgi:hypothetical protein